MSKNVQEQLQVVEAFIVDGNLEGAEEEMVVARKLLSLNTCTECGSITEQWVYTDGNFFNVKEGAYLSPDQWGIIPVR